MVRETSIVRRPTSGVCGALSIRPFALGYFPRVVILALISALGCTSMIANDTEFHGRGGVLTPVKNSKIRMVREDLSVKFVEYSELNQQDHFAVSVDYVFMNDGPATSITVGFVCPPTLADYEGVELNDPIDDHTVVMNGRSIEVEHVKMQQEGVVKGLHVKADHHVYLFTARFAKGRNVISHRYKHAESGSVWLYREFEYVLKTGANWAKGRIDTFNLTIDIGRCFEEDGFMFMPLDLTDGAFASDWILDSTAVRVDTICGSDLTSDEYGSFIQEEFHSKRCPGNDFLVVLSNVTKLSYSAINFVPRRDLWVGYLGGVWANWVDAKRRSLAPTGR